MLQPKPLHGLAATHYHPLAWQMLEHRKDCFILWLKIVVAKEVERRTLE